MRKSIIGIFICCLGLLNAAEPLEFAVGSFNFERPAGWKWIVPSSAMRKAQLQVDGEGKDPAEITFFHFGSGQGGGIQANIDRWVGQFQDGEHANFEKTFGGTRVVFVTAEGTFFSGMPGGALTPRPDYGLRGAILEDRELGDVFVKMTGPKSLVASVADQFDTMIQAAAESLRK